MQKFKNIDEFKDNINLTHRDNKIFKFKIKVIANSSLDLIDFEEEFIKVKIRERALEGKANKAIIEFLSKNLKFPKAKISILNGEKSSIKTIAIKP